MRRLAQREISLLFVHLARTRLPYQKPLALYLLDSAKKRKKLAMKRLAGGRALIPKTPLGGPSLRFCFFARVGLLTFLSSAPSF